MGPSQTAELAAAHRAYHLMHDRPTILEDSAAIWLLGPPLSVVLRVAPLRIPIDFEREAIAAALCNQQYYGDVRAFVSWLGTMCYLTRGAIEATLASLAMACAPGSRVVFDYFQPRSTMSPADLQLFEELDRGDTRRGEPMRTLVDSEEMAGMLHAAGFRVVEDLSAAEIRRRYLLHRSDGLDIPGFARLCCAERAV